jgi:DNA adenine methylase
MTSYHGGKQRVGKSIAEVIFDIVSDTEDQYDIKFKGYCEPFCGMLGVYQHIPDLFKDHKPKLKYKAGDINESVIKMWKASQNGWTPPTTCTKKKFDTLKYDDKTSAEKGFIGHAFSFGGQYFKGFSPKYGATNNRKHSSDKVINISKNLSTVKFKHGNYKDYSKLKNYIIYCDPPYSKTNCEYKNENRNQLKFDHKLFWEWVRYMSKNNIVFVSEYSAPKDFIEILKTKHIFHNVNQTKINKDDKLFIYNN